MPCYSSALSVHVLFQAYWVALDKNKSKGEARSGSVDSYDRDQIPSHAMGFLRRGYLNRTLLWLIGDWVTPWTSEPYLSLEADQRVKEMRCLRAEMWSLLLPSLPSPLSDCCTGLQVLLVWLCFMFSASSAGHEFRNLQQDCFSALPDDFQGGNDRKQSSVQPCSPLDSGFGDFYPLPT